MAEGFVGSAVGKWNAFLEWLDGKGIPLKAAADAIEEKGIPSLPVFLLLLALVIFGLAQVLPSLFTAAPGSAVITVTAADGTPVAGATVKIYSLNADSKYTNETITASDGRATFRGIPAGKARLLVSSPDYIFPDASQDLTVESDSINKASVSAQAIQLNTVAVYFQVEGPSNASVYLQDSITGSVLGTRDAASGSFEVDPNREYLLRASAPGYSPVEQSVRVGSSNYGSVSLVLVKIGETAASQVHIAVWDNAGEALANATVQFVDIATGERVYSLKTGGDGKTPVQEVPLGSSWSIIASADGFLTRSIQFNASTREMWPEAIRMVKGNADTTSLITITVTDATGKAINSPIVSLYSRELSFNGTQLAKYQDAPFTGEASFQIAASESGQLSATAYKPGYLPSVLLYATAGEHALALATATDDASGVVNVRVTAADGSEVSGALVTLLAKERAPFGIPAKITGLDGLQSFSDAPLKEMVAVASYEGRVAFSEPFTPQSRTASPQGASAEVAFPLLKARTRFSVRDHYASKPVASAQVSVSSNGEDYSCATDKNGVCYLDLYEGQAVATVAAQGYEGLTPPPLSIVAGADNSNAFELVSTQFERASRLVFEGLYTLDGEKVNSVNPFTTYNAKYLLTAPQGLSFTKANAHVRVGDMQTLLGGDNAVIVAYSAVGASITRGTSYEGAQTTAQPTEESAAAGPATVYFDEAGFTPQDLQVVSGSLVTFENKGGISQKIKIGDLIQGVTIAANKSFAYEFKQTGDFQLSSEQFPDNAGTITCIPAASAEETGAASTAAAAGEQSGLTFKWVNFEFQRFTGTRELLVQIRTGAPSAQPVTLNHRTAFYAATDVLRDPADSDAGASKAELLAFTAISGSFANDFQGECSPELNFCYRVVFSGATYSSQYGFQANLGESFKLYYSVYGLPNSQFTITAKADGAALAFESLGGTNGTRFAQVAAQVRTGDTGQASGFFTVFPQRISEDASVTFTVSSAAGETVVEKRLSLRVISERQPKLRVAVVPTSLTALDSSTLTFTVTDEYGLPVEDAAVSVGKAASQLLAGSVIEAAPLEGQPGVYAAENVQPSGIGGIDFAVTAPFFSRSTGRLQVKAPAAFFEATPASIQASVDSADGAVTSFVVSNKLSNELRVTATVFTATNPSLTSFSLASASMRVKGGEQAENWLYSYYAQDAMLIAEKPQTLREDVQGRIRLRGRIGSVVQTVEIPFVSRTSLVQTSLDDAWALSADSLQFQLNNENEKTATVSLAITNNAPYPLLINRDDSSPAVTVAPASLSLQPGDSADLQVTASIAGVTAESCMDLDAEGLNGVLSLYASFQGVKSKKIVPIQVQLVETSPCLPDNGYSVSFPVDASFALLPGYRSKQNYDGSTTLQPFGEGDELMLVQTGASFSGSTLTIPQQSPVLFPPQWVAQIQPNGWQLMLPMQVTLYMTDELNPARQADGSVTVELYDGTLTLKPGASVAGRTVIVPAGDPIIFQPTQCNTVYSALPQVARELKAPVEMVFYPPTGSSIASDDKLKCQATQSSYLPAQAASFLQANTIIQLPDGRRIGFTSEAQLQKLADGSVSRVNIPAQAGVMVPAEFAYQSSESADAVTAVFPMPVQLVYSTDVAAPIHGNGVYSIRFSEEAAVQFTFDPAPAKVSGKQVVTIPAYSPITFLSGASAMEIEDPSVYSRCQQYFTPDDTVQIVLPAGALTKKEAGQTVVIMPDCTAASKVRITRLDEYELYESPASKKIAFSSATFVSGTMDGREPKTLRVPKNAKISFYTCEKADDDLKAATLTLPMLATVLLPEGGAWKSETSIEFSRPAAIKINYGSKSFDTGKAKKVEFDPSNIDDYQRPAKNAKDKTGTSAANTVRLPENSRVSFVPVCDSAARSLEIKADASYLKVVVTSDDKTEPREPTPANPISITLTNDHSAGYNKFLVDLCLINVGSKTVDLKSVAVKPTSIGKNAGLINAALLTDADHFYFTEATGSTDVRGPMTKTLAPDNQCNPYHIEVVVPASVKNAYTGCLTVDKKITVLGEITFATDYENKAGTRTVPVQLVIDPTAVACASGGTGKTANDDVVRVSFDPRDFYAGDGRVQFTFKGLGAKHYRFLSITNNRDEEMQLEITGSEALHCEYASGDGSASGREAKTGDTLAPGWAEVLRCYPLAKTGAYKMIFYGSKTGRASPFTKTVSVKVYEPDPTLAEYYQDTPLGKINCPDAASCLPLPETTQGNTASMAAVAPAKSDAATTPAAKTDKATQVKQISDAAYLNLCESYYCTFDQAGRAYSAFLNEYLKILGGKLSTEAQFEWFYNQFSNRQQPLRRSAVIQMTATKLPPAQQLTAFSDAAREADTTYKAAGFDGGVQLSENFLTNAQSELQGCGVYILTATPKAAPAPGTVDERRKNVVVELDLRRAASCTPNDDLEPKLANAALLMPPDETYFYVGREKISWAGFDFTKFIQWPPNVYLGSFTDTADSKDSQTAQAWFEAAYGLDPNENFAAVNDDYKADKPTHIKRYENMGYCLGSLAKPCGSLALAGGAACAGSTLGLFATWGASAAVTGRLAFSACSGVARLVTCIPAASAISGCRGLNECGQLAVMHIFDLIGSGLPLGAGQVLADGGFKSLMISSAAGSAAGIGLTSLVSQGLQADGAYLGGKASAGIFAKGGAISRLKMFSQLRDGGITLANGQTITTFKNTYATNMRAIMSNNPVRAAQLAQDKLAAQIVALDDKIRQAPNPATANRLINQQQKLLQQQTSASVTESRLIAQGENAYKYSAKAAFVKTAAVVALTEIMIKVDGRPVRAELPYFQIPNFVIAMHEQPSDGYTLEAYCWLSEDSPQDKDSTHCEDMKSLANLCPAGQRDACVFFAEAKRESDAEKAGTGFVIAAFFNNDKASQTQKRKFFRSLLDPDSAPLTYAEFKGMLSNNEGGRVTLNNRVTDEGALGSSYPEAAKVYAEEGKAAVASVGKSLPGYEKDMNDIKPAEGTTQ